MKKRAPLALAAAAAGLTLSFGGAATAADGDHYYQMGPFYSLADCRAEQLSTPNVVESCQEYGADPGKYYYVYIIKGYM